MAGATYGVGVLACLRPGAPALTALRLMAIGLLAVVCIPALAVIDHLPAGGLLTLGLIMAALAWSPPVGQLSADAEAVAGECRFILATPWGLAVFIGPLVAAVAMAGPFVALMLILDGRPLIGAIGAAPAAAAAWFGGRAVHRLSRRWLVLVPSGVVIHDPLLLNDTCRLSPSEVGVVALTAPGWRARLERPDVLDITGGANRGLWLGLTGPFSPPTTRPGVRRPRGPVRHVFCAPLLRGEAAAALATRGYALAEPLGPP